ncbi:glycerol kinase GlpK [Ileibacterium valens]|uniref:Glycerol kinase n=1 Tax=Ileibacterium valens TaxID=1862668 RepID=A0A1U7NDZ9_9FIRM|nr:glycerol kinase GlpK [Ileibacterium valens]OLU37640.1 glycerol kinase [Ileibacterium valens]OLU37728.1 glycerol kinase [Erysipelotrichaceae bacterium NYU-BL-F16]OLU38104.1 glycerol kinase [Erysipelotrichaceae bacterium NYU-BL-E8]
MSKKEYILAIDHGTTSTRAILFDHDCRICGISQKEGSVDYPSPGWVEQDAVQIWLDTMAVMADVLNQSGIDPDQVKGIGISNQRETTVLWDKKTGLPIYKAIVWQSRQTSDICDEWKSAGYEQTIREKTGLRIDPYFSASKIAWILENIPDARKKAENGDLLFGTMDSWIVWKLTGGEQHITDATNASRTLLCNIENVEWDQDLLEMFNIPESILPRIVPTSENYGSTAPYAFFGAQVPICSMVGDQQAALFGQLCLEKGMAKNTYGTGGFLLMNTGDEIVRSKNGLLSTIAWQIGDEVTYALEGSIFVSGSIMKWMRDKLQLFDKVSQTEKMAKQAGTTAGVYIIPAFVGLGAPYWDDKAKASIVGLSLGTNRNQLIRAALESMAYQSRDVLNAMERDSGLSIPMLKVDGGGAMNNFLLQFQSDLIQVPVERYKVNELTALGAAFLAGLAIDFWKKEDLSIEMDKRFDPQRSAQEMDQRYQNWQNAVKACQAFKSDTL